MAPTELVERTVEIPQGVSVEVSGRRIKVTGPKGTLEEDLSHIPCTMELEQGLVRVRSMWPRREDIAMAGTAAAHLRNMIKGVTQEYECTMKTVFSHFPIKTSVEGNHLIIQNFLGERFPRRAEILENVKVEIKGEQIILKAADKEKVGQTAANIERATKVKNRDIRVFQDGIYIVKRG